MNRIFVTAIDTGAGKTRISGLLARDRVAAGSRVITAKICQTGCSGISEDIQEHRRIMGASLYPEDIQGLTCPYVFPFPASPHLSARLTGSVIDPGHILRSLEKLYPSYQDVIVEGVGGVMVPLREDYSTLDLLRDTGLSAVVVTTPRLGSINHTLLTMEVLRQAQIPVLGLLFNRLDPALDQTIAEESLQFFTRHYAPLPVLDIPVFEAENYPQVDFSQIFNS